VDCVCHDCIVWYSGDWAVGTILRPLTLAGMVEGKRSAAWRTQVLVERRKPLDSMSLRLKIPHLLTS
jgi:hypothetical protein